MKKRVITGVLLGAAVVVLLACDGAVMAVAALLCACVAMREEYHALKVAGNRPVAWPTWVGMALSIPLALLMGVKVLIPLVLTTFLLTVICVMFRSEPRLEDALLSIMPLFTVMLPGMFIVSLSMVQPKGLQVVLLGLTFAVPSMGDMFALFVGCRVGGPKFCPAVSPNKTISGAIAGLVGSLLGSLLVYGVARLCCSPETCAHLPGLAAHMVLGILGGAAGQLGDLFASLIKRHCGMKDFSNLFPGHGGMLDRMDSILFMALVMFCYYLFITP